MKKIILFSVFILFFSKINAQLKPESVKKIGNQPLSKTLTEISFQPEAILEWLCPSRLVRGDREFDGHGPKIKCEVKLSINRDSTDLVAEIDFWAQETQHDWSSTEGHWSKKIYDAPYGVKIKKILSDKASRTQFISPPAGYQIFAPGTDVAKAAYDFLDHTDIKSAVLSYYKVKKTDQDILTNLIKTYVEKGNQIVQVPPVEGALVKFFYIVGDTGSDDISSDENCNDDTRIEKIEFFPVKIEIINRK
ncbi:MAG: hypothetical protein KA143_08545 [Saprospiraceae bacterium]|nr:hypothetical protein [Saprospiraceae bacterium]